MRVLLVDDDPDQLCVTGRYLSRAGFSVITCEDGDEAIAAMEGMDFDAVVSDVQMPRVNGLSLAQWVGANRPGMKMIVMTAFGSSEIFKGAMRRGAVLYLEKPVDPKLLVEVLSRPSGEREENEQLLSACIEAEKKEGGGEVIVRQGDLIGRIFFTDGKIAWAASTGSPGLFIDTLLEKTGLERTVVEMLVTHCRRDGSNIVDRLVEKGHVNEMVMRKVLLATVASVFTELSGWRGAQAIYIPVKRPFSGRFAIELADVLAELSPSR